MDKGQHNDVVHFSPLKRKTNQKDSRQNEGPTHKARTILAVLPGQRTQNKLNSN